MRNLRYCRGWEDRSLTVAARCGALVCGGLLVESSEQVVHEMAGAGIVAKGCDGDGGSRACSGGVASDDDLVLLACDAMASGSGDDPADFGVDLSIGNGVASAGEGCLPGSEDGGDTNGVWQVSVELGSGVSGEKPAGLVQSTGGAGAEQKQAWKHGNEAERVVSGGQF